MRYRAISIILTLSVLIGFPACGKDAANEAAALPEEEGAALSPSDVRPSSPSTADGTKPSAPSAPLERDDVEPPAPSEPDYRALAAEILTTIWDGDVPEAAEVSEGEDPISNRLEIELSYPMQDGSIDITFDKETGRLRCLSESGFSGLLKPAQYDGPESAARTWYAALPLPQGYSLGSVTNYGDDLLCYEFNKPVTLETGGEPAELLSSYEAVRIMVHTDTGALSSAIAFYWPVFDGHPQKTAISEEEAVAIAKGSGSRSGNETVSSQITLYQPLDPIAVSDCTPEQSLDYSFPAWEVAFREKSGEFDCVSLVYVDLYTGEILGRSMC